MDFGDSTQDFYGFGLDFCDSSDFGWDPNDSDLGHDSCDSGDFAQELLDFVLNVLDLASIL